MKKQILLTSLILLTSMFLSAQEAKYEFKSAIIKSEVSAFGQKIETTTYIDDYGKKESSETIVKMPGTDNKAKHLRTIMDGASVINIDLDLKKAIRIPLPEKPINYLNLTPEIKEKFKMKESGTEDIAGKPCKKYALEVSQMEQTVEMKTCIWKGIPLKTESSSNGMVLMTQTVTDIQENVPVKAEIFTLPEGITLPD